MIIYTHKRFTNYLKMKEGNKMEIIVADNYDDISRIAASYIKELINEKSDAVLGLATGGTPVGTYKQLIDMYSNKEIDFSNVKTINLDEYIGLDGSHVQSYRYFMNNNLFDHINVKKENTHVPNGMAKDTDEEARKYDELIENFGGIDLQILGVGANGHIAFNEPGPYLNVNTHVTNLTDNTIEANARFFDSIVEVAKTAITMGVGNIMKAKKIIVLANGKNKAEAVEKMINGKVAASNPASILQLHRDVTLIIDKDIKEEIER